MSMGPPQVRDGWSRGQAILRAHGARRVPPSHTLRDQSPVQEQAPGAAPRARKALALALLVREAALGAVQAHRRRVAGGHVHVGVARAARPAASPQPGSCGSCPTRSSEGRLRPWFTSRLPTTSSSSPWARPGSWTERSMRSSKSSWISWALGESGGWRATVAMKGSTTTPR